MDAFLDIALLKQPSVNELVETTKNLEREKWDCALPPDLLMKTYASLNLDIEEAKEWVISKYGQEVKLALRRFFFAWTKGR